MKLRDMLTCKGSFVALRVVLSCMLVLALLAASIAPLSASADNTTITGTVIPEKCPNNSIHDWAPDDITELGKVIIPIDDEIDLETNFWSCSRYIDPSNGNSLSLYVKNRGNGTLTITILKDGVSQRNVTLLPGSFLNTLCSITDGAMWTINVVGTKGIKMSISARQY